MNPKVRLYDFNVYDKNNKDLIDEDDDGTFHLPDFMD